MIVKKGKHKGQFKKVSKGKGKGSSRFEGCRKSGKSAKLCAFIGRRAGKIK